MNRTQAINTAIDFAKTALATSQSFDPMDSTADTLADFIETLAKRLESLDEGNN